MRESVSPARTTYVIDAEFGAVSRGNRRRAGNGQHLTDRERTVAPQTVAVRQVVHAHAVGAGDAPERVAAADDVFAWSALRRTGADSSIVSARASVAASTPRGAAVISRS